MNREKAEDWILRNWINVNTVLKIPLILYNILTQVVIFVVASLYFSKVFSNVWWVWWIFCLGFLFRVLGVRGKWWDIRIDIANKRKTLVIPKKRIREMI